MGTTGNRSKNWSEMGMQINNGSIINLYFSGTRYLPQFPRQLVFANLAYFWLGVSLLLYAMQELAGIQDIINSIPF
jgi:hypothetical protein